MNKLSQPQFEAPTPHTYLVAGGGGGMRSTIILRMLAQELTERKLSYTVVEGTSGEGDEEMVRYPSLQAKDMEASIAEQPEDTPLLFISHCIGTVAGLETLEKVDGTRPASLVAIAPPLPSPRATIMTPQSQKKRSEGDTFMSIVNIPPEAMDYSATTKTQAHISPKYFTDIHAADDLGPRLKANVEAGKAAVHAPEYDWNVESPRTVRDWHEEWQSTLTPEDAEVLQGRAALIYNAAHGLYLSPRSGLEITPEADLAFQAQNVSNLVDAGLELIEAQQAAAQY